MVDKETVRFWENQKFNGAVFINACREIAPQLYLLFLVGWHANATSLAPGPNVIKLFTTVIYCHSMVIPSLYYKATLTW
jgi:hypothetical protein